MRVHADRRVQPRIRLGELGRPLTRPDVPAWDEDPLEPGAFGTIEDVSDVRIEAVGVEVAVAVDEAHARYGAASGTRHQAGPVSHSPISVDGRCAVSRAEPTNVPMCVPQDRLTRSSDCAPL